MANIYRPSAKDTLSLQELALYHGIMDYRAQFGLAPVPLSQGLTTTAARHTVDTRRNVLDGDGFPAGQNLHTWSDAPYFSDGSNPQAMWEAPQRLGTGYTDTGYEISAAGQRNVFEALNGWQTSPSHNRVILNLGPWEPIEYSAIGIGVDTSRLADPYLGRVFHVWFGDARDPTGPPLILGSTSTERIRGTVFADRIAAGDGHDVIGGQSGPDEIDGGAGRDRIYGGDGRDRLTGAGGADELRGNFGNDLIAGGFGADRLYGGKGSDVLSGGPGNDIVAGGSGGDTLIGGSGGDILNGGPGGDRIAGEGGADLLYGGAGPDVLIGGNGTDQFVFRSLAEAGDGALRDVIIDFQPMLDHVNLRGIDADFVRPGNQAFAFIGGAAFSGTPGELAYRGGVLRGDVNGDGRADFQIDIGNSVLLGADDIFL